MKKRNMKQLALLGVATGLLAMNQVHAANPTSKPTSNATKTSSNQNSTKDNKDSNDPNDGNMGYHLMSEEELLIELNSEGHKLYESLDPEGKALALEVASMRCGGTNKCAGLNACATDKNACAGQGSCKGTGKCAVADKNLAVKLVAQKMAKKRAGMMNKSGQAR